MTRRRTFSEERWPIDARSIAEARQWAGDVAVQVLDLIWRSFDRLKENHLAEVDLAQPLEQLERNLAALHFIELNTLWAQETGGYSSIVPIPEWPELESRPAAPGKPPAYDFAFVFTDNQRVSWPIEAKVVPTPNTLAAYMSDITKFVSGVAAPLTGEGGVIAYLLDGEELEFLVALESKLGEPLKEISASALMYRAHRVSQHERSPASQLRLHHLVMLCKACSQ